MRVFIVTAYKDGKILDTWSFSDRTSEAMQKLREYSEKGWNYIIEEFEED